MTGEEERDGVARHHLTDGTRRVRVTDLARDPTVGANFTRRDLGGLAQSRALEFSQLGDVDRAKVDAPSPKPLLYRILDPSGRVGRQGGTAQTAFDVTALFLEVADFDSDEGDGAPAPGDH